MFILKETQYQTGERRRAMLWWRFGCGCGHGGTTFLHHTRSTRQRYRGIVSSHHLLHTCKLVLTQHDMQRAWLLISTAFSYIRRPYG